MWSHRRVVWELLTETENLMGLLAFVTHVDLLPTWISVKAEALLSYPAMKWNRIGSSSSFWCRKDT